MEAGVAELAGWAAGRGVVLTEAQGALVSRYAGEVLAYNEKTNLTAEKDLRGLLLRHLADGLAAASILRPRLKAAAPRILDLGSGGGFIGVALKIAWPEAEVTLAEPSKRRFDFLSLAAARLALKGLRVVKAGAGPNGGLSAREKDFDAVLERALAPLPEAVSLGLPLASASGLFGAYQSDPPDPAEPALSRALAKSSGRLVEAVRYRLPLEEKDRWLALFSRLEN